MRVFVSLLLCFLLIVPASAADVYETDSDVQLYSVGPGNPEYTFIDGVLKYAPFGGTPSTLVSMTVPQLLNFYGIATLDDVEARATTVPMMVNALQTYFGNPANKAGSSNVLWYDAVNTGILGASGSVIGKGVSNSSYSLAEIVANGFMGLSDNSSRMQKLLYDRLGEVDSRFLADTGWTSLNSDGTYFTLTQPSSFTSLLPRGFLGLSHNLVGDDKQTTFTFLAEDVTQASDKVTVDNILDALGIMGTQLQNPLQKLAFVFANDQDLEIREDVSENLDAAQENFFKPGGNGSVSAGDIGDAAGISGGAAGALSSPGSVGDLTAQMNNSDNFSFFSQITLGNLDTVPVVVDDTEEDFIDFYDPSNPALWEALGR